MKFITAETIRSTIEYPQLITALRDAFRSQSVEVPQRHHHHYRYSAAHDNENTLLLMPAWQANGFLGVKTVVVAPDNREQPSIQGQYALFDAATGTPRAIMDAASITAMRTAAASALAADYLAPTDASVLLMVGTGTLAPELIRAHASVRPIKEVLVWGRSAAKAQRVVDSVSELPCVAKVCEDIEQGMAQADIVSCATLSKTPLIQGSWLRPNQHIDLVGAYRPDMREADDDLIRQVALYVDVMPHALAETGDLCIPLSNGVISESSVLGHLPSLCQSPAPIARQGVTCFKSVGHALEDLVAATLVHAVERAREDCSLAPLLNNL
ncbi:ornithine cyclodeaminase family protein [Microbulbifer salipaludis]|uniref:Ornithine cyclodeaminase family protein n=1 Tax=Microbulbifer salipaludis TaxID=187980 RepID=A0ABS3E8N4_9GAMM|nr:ornithine cyclodeaminase family protein [Microbulbifer salipaludis]MBN8431674.1 ornithine cyclodeaminase family protein [Microbulbifer salipaludis]